MNGRIKRAVVTVGVIAALAVPASAQAAMIYGNNFGNTLYTTWGPDFVGARGGNDVVWSDMPDGQVDNIDCGTGNDVAYVRPEDNTDNCEQVVRIPNPGPGGVIA